MTDFCDAASDLSDYHLALSLRQHANRKPEPLPICEECESKTVHIFASGVNARYCFDCIEELREEGK